jgi:hypothetical protein
MYGPLLDPDDPEVVCLHSIAAHAHVQNGVTVNYFSPGDPVTINVAWPGGDSYLNVDITGGNLDGTYDSFCIETDLTITPGVNYDAVVYSSYHDHVDDNTTLGYLNVVEFPLNLDLVNWIINQNWVAQYCDCAGRLFTSGDVQRAIWELIEDTESAAGLGTWNQCCADVIRDDALANGDGFVPDCDELLALVLIPVDDKQRIIAQVVTAAVELSCVGATAWGDGGVLPGNEGQGSWARYISYENTCQACD